MPNIRAAFKSVRQNKKRHIRNISIKTELHSLIKKVRASIAEKKREEADSLLKALESKLYKAAKVNVIKKNNAARHISRLRHAWASLK